MAANLALASRLGAVSLAVPDAARRAFPMLLVSAAALGWAGLFAWLAVARHLAEGSHAEDLGWTDQVLNNFTRGQWFRMSIYQDAFWNTELNIDAIRRPDSLLAFHVEPMLLLLVPLYALGGMATSLLVLQALGFATGAIPAYRIGARLTGSSSAGMALAAAYLLSPLGQWAVLSDFHTSTLAAPLLLLAADLLLAGEAGWKTLCVAGLAMSAREDVAPVVALLGVLAVFGLGVPRQPAAGLRLVLTAMAWTLVCALLIHAYSGGVSPFDVRYASLRDVGVSPLLLRPSVTGYAATLLAGGGWLAVLSPLAVLPALPSLLLNVLSTSEWMASGKAHYSALVLPFVVLGAGLTLGRLSRRPRLLRVTTAALTLSTAMAYAATGSGPLAADFAPATITEHAQRVAAVADSLPSDAAVSATSAVVPHLTRRAHVYVFPTVLDADYVLLDLHASPAPTSAGDVFLRVQSLLADGGWQVRLAADGLLLLRRAADAPSSSSAGLGAALFPRGVPPVAGVAATAQSFEEMPGTRGLRLLDARLVPASDSSIDVDGPRGTLRTTWRTPDAPIAPGTRLEFWLDLGTAEPRHVWDIAPLWWNPPEAWAPDTTITLDVPDVPLRQFRSWRAELR